MARAERSRLVMKLSWQIFRSSDVSHSEAMRMAHAQVERKLNPERASRKIRRHVRETFESLPEHIFTSGLKKPVYVPVDISKLPTGDIKLSSVYRRGWQSSALAGKAGFPHGCGRNKSEVRAVSKLQNKRNIQVSRDDRRTLIPTDMLRLAPVYKGHTSYREYQ